MKDLGKAKKIIGWEITQNLVTGTLNINQKGYIQNLLEFKEMTFYYPTILPVKATPAFFLDQASNHY